MPAVMERPVIIHDTVDEMMPTWILIISETHTQSYLDIQLILEKVLPELNEDKIRHLVSELRAKHTVVAFRDIKEVIERYYERLHKQHLDVRMELE